MELSHKVDIIVLGIFLTYVVTTSYLLAPFRGWITKKLGTDGISFLVYCPACFGFWCGAALSFLGPETDPVVLGAYVSMLSLLLSRFVWGAPPELLEDEHEQKDGIHEG